MSRRGTRVALLDELYVVPRLRGHGIGSAIIDELMPMARARGVGLIEINVDEGDVDAQRFYERHGFSATGPGSTERAFYYFQELATGATCVAASTSAACGPDLCGPHPAGVANSSPRRPR